MTENEEFDLDYETTYGHCVAKIRFGLSQIWSATLMPSC